MLSRLSRRNRQEENIPQEGDLYARIEHGGRTFDLYYGYYEECDRQNPLVAELVEKNTEPTLRLIEQAAHAIHETGGWIGICGELAADLRLTQRFVDMRVDELSVSPPYLLGVREKVTECK